MLDAGRIQEEHHQEESGERMPSSPAQTPSRHEEQQQGGSQQGLHGRGPAHQNEGEEEAAGDAAGGVPDIDQSRRIGGSGCGGARQQGEGTAEGKGDGNYREQGE